MAHELLPEQNKTIGELAREMKEIRDRVMTRSTDMGWLMRIFHFVLNGVITPLALLWLGYLLSQKP